MKMPLVCRTCLQNIPNVVPYNENYADFGSKTIKEQLAVCFPDLNLEITKNFVLCLRCVRKLSVIYKYFEECMNVEKKITECITKRLVKADSDWSDFSNALRETSKFKEEYNGVDVHNMAKFVDLNETSMPVLDIPNTSMLETITINSLLSAPFDATKLNVTLPMTEPSASDKTDTDDVVFVEDVAKYFCESCQSTFNTSSHVCVPVTKKNNLLKKSQMFKCYKCSGVFSSRKILNSHFISLHTSTFSCEWCNFTSKSFDKFKTHIRCHLNSPKIFKCIVCCALFATKTLLEEHFLTHFICVKCGRKFTVLKNLKKHTAICTSVVKSYTCSACDSIFETESDLDLHRLTHIECSFKCPSCMVYSAEDETTLFSHLQSCNNKMVVVPSVIQAETDDAEQEWINYDQQLIVNV